MGYPSAVPSLSAATLAEDVFKMMYTCQSTNLIRGTVACQQTSSSDLNVVDPDSANAGPVVGLVMSGGTLSAGAYSAPAVNDPILVQRFGRAIGLLATSQTITRGDALGAVAGSGGKLGLYMPGQGMKFVGVAAQSKTTSATSLYVEVDIMANPRAQTSLGISGFASTTYQNATKYLSAAGTAIASATPVVLFVVPPGGGYLRNLVASDTTAPGGTDTDVFAAYVNSYSAGVYAGFGAASALTCTITGTAMRAHDITHAVAVNEGDLVAIGVVASTTSLGAGRAATLQFTQTL